MKIIKRNGSEVTFDISKIIAALNKANNTVNETARMTQEQILGIAATIEEDCVRMNRAPSVEEIQEMVRSGKLTAGHARAVLSIKSEKKQLEAAQKIAALGLSVRQAELLCKNMSKEQPKEKEITLAVDYVAECEKTLSKHLGRGVKIVNGKRKGRFELEFYGQEDLQVLLDALMKLQK